MLPRRKVYREEELDQLLENWDRWSESEDDVDNEVDSDNDAENDTIVPSPNDAVALAEALDLEAAVQNNGK